MSKNFELLQNAEVTLGHAHHEAPAPITPITRAQVAAAARRTGEALNLDKVTREESLHLVQKVFLTGTEDRRTNGDVCWPGSRKWLQPDMRRCC